MQIFSPLSSCALSRFAQVVRRTIKLSIRWSLRMEKNMNECDLLINLLQPETTYGWTLGFFTKGIASGGAHGNVGNRNNPKEIIKFIREGIQ